MDTTSIRLPKPDTSLRRVQKALEAVGARASRGESLDAIAEDVIEPGGLPDEHKSALWL